MAIILKTFTFYVGTDGLDIKSASIGGCIDGDPFCIGVIRALLTLQVSSLLIVAGKTVGPGDESHS